MQYYAQPDYSGTTNEIEHAPGYTGLKRVGNMIRSYLRTRELVEKFTRIKLAPQPEGYGADMLLCDLEPSSGHGDWTDEVRVSMLQAIKEIMVAEGHGDMPLAWYIPLGEITAKGLEANRGALEHSSLVQIPLYQGEFSGHRMSWIARMIERATMVRKAYPDHGLQGSISTTYKDNGWTGPSLERYETLAILRSLNNLGFDSVVFSNFSQHQSGGPYTLDESEEWFGAFQEFLVKG